MFDLHDPTAIEVESTHEERHASETSLASQIGLPIFVIGLYLVSRLTGLKAAPLIGLGLCVAAGFVVFRRFTANQVVDPTLSESGRSDRRWRTDRAAGPRTPSDRRHIEVGGKYQASTHRESSTL